MRTISGQSSNKLIGDLPDVPGPHGEDDVAGVSVLHDMFDDLVMIGKVLGIDAVRPDAFNELLAVDSRAIGGAVSHEVDIGNQEVIAFAEASGEVGHEESGA